MREIAKKNLTISALLATTALAAPAFAQDAMSDTVPHARQQLDENGVNWATGEVVNYTTPLSIGANRREGLQYSLAHGHAQSGSNWTLDLTGVAGSSFTAVVGVRAINFNYVNGTYVPDDGSGATFVVNSSSQYTLTLEDGTVIVFNNFPHDTEAARGTSITYPTGETMTLAYNSISWCTTLLDTCNSYGYATRLQSVTSSVGYQLHYTYGKDDITVPSESNGWKKLNSITAFNTTVDSCDPYAGTCTFSQSWPEVSFTTTGGVTDALGNTTTYTDSATQYTIQRPSATSPDFTANFDSNARVTSITRDGQTWSYSFTPGTGTMTAVRTDPLGHTRTVVSSTSVGLPTSVTDENGHVTTYGYNSSNQLTTVTYPEGNYTQYAYDGRGNRTTTTAVAKSGSGLANIVTSAAYPSSCTNTASCNEPISTTDAKGNVTTYTYDSAGELLTATAPAPTTGAVQPQTRYTYTSITTPGGTAISELKTTSQCQTTASCAGTADEVKTTYNYSNQLLPTSATVANGTGTLSATTANTYDNIGNLLTVDGPLAGSADTTRYRYDADRRLIGTTSPSPGNGQPDRATRITYNADGQVSEKEAGTVTDQSDTAWSNFTSLQAVTVGFDSYGRPITQQLTAGGTAYAETQVSRDALGRVNCTAVRMNTAAYGSLPASACTQTTGNTDQISQTIFDNAGEVTQVQVGVGTAAAANERTIAYNSNGTVASLTDAKNNVTSYTYDGFDRPIKATYPATPAYPNGTTEQVTVYDANGNATTTLNRAGQTISFNYDALNRVTHKGGTAIPDVDYTYDNLNRLLSATYSTGGLGITNVYDALSRLTSSSSNVDGTARQFSYTYDLVGRRTQMTYPDGYYLNYDYLTTGEVQKIRANGATSGINVLATYAYDALGNRTSLTLGNGVVTSYGYDPVARLTSLTHDLAGSSYDLTKTFAYNPGSEITSATSSNDAYAWNGAVNTNRPYTPNALNQYASVNGTTFGYDANGNLTSDGTNTFAYDAENHLTSATIGGAAATLSYDPAGRLWHVVKGSTDLRFYYDGDHMAAHYDNTGTLQYRYVFGPGADAPLLQYNPSGVRTWYTADERGSIISDSNDSGTFQLANTYDEYGIPGSANSGRFQYTGQMWVSELGMYFYKARAYSPTLGRFMQTDPIGYGDGMNWYAYTHNDPVNGSDPSGLEALYICRPVSAGIFVGDDGTPGGQSGGYAAPKEVCSWIDVPNYNGPLPSTPPSTGGTGGGGTVTVVPKLPSGAQPLRQSRQSIDDNLKRCGAGKVGWAAAGGNVFGVVGLGAVNGVFLTGAGGIGTFETDHWGFGLDFSLDVSAGESPNIDTFTGRSVNLAGTGGLWGGSVTLSESNRNISFSGSRTVLAPDFPGVNVAGTFSESWTFINSFVCLR